jgi:hypothetical protein
MATVTGYTAERMKAIEDASVIDGEIDGSGNLLLTRYDGTTITAGSVVGPAGPPGATGEVSTVAMNAAIAAAVNALKATVYAVVNHGSNATTTRPSGYAGVIWYGSVQPTNMTGVDIVIRTDEVV